MILKGYLFSIGYGVACLLLSSLLYKLGLDKKFSRKVVHILVGFEWVILYHFFGAGLHFLFVCLAFTALLAVAYFFKLLPMISSEQDNSPGTVYYGVAMSGVAILGCFYPPVMLPFGIAIWCTSVGDGLAGVVGQAIRKHNPKIYADKSLYGTLANLVASLLGGLALIKIYGIKLSFFEMLCLAILAVLLELITPLGLDNIAITWGVTALAVGFLSGVGMSFIAPVLLTPLVIAFALSKGALTRGGIVAAVIVDILISVPLGNFGFIIMFSFFVIAIITDKIKRRVKKSSDEGLKGERRDYMQVLANSLAAAACAFAYFLTPSRLFILGFVAAFAEALADTASSAFGVFAKNTFDPFRFKRCEGGLSGGMSLIGTFAGFVGAFLIGTVAYAFGVLNGKMLLIVVFSGFIGSVFDSLLGSLLQVKYKCTVCGKITEKREHHGEKTVRVSGFELVDNDIVNLSSSAFAAILAVVLGTLVG